MNDKITGLVLNESEYRENDSLYQIITPDKGFLTVIGKGIRKISHKQSISVMDLYEFIIDYQDNKTMYICKNTKLLRRFNGFDDISSLSLRNVAIEAVLKSKDLYEPEMYDALYKTFDYIAAGETYLPLCLLFSYLLKKHGVTPFVDGCVVCGATKVAAISSRHGGFLCVDHMSGLDPVDVMRLKKFRLFNKAEFKDHDLITDVEADIADLKIMVDFFRDNTDINLKSFDFLQRFI